MNRNIWIYDLETIKSVFTAIFLNIDTEEIKTFIIHKDRNDLSEFTCFILKCKRLIGYNNIDFDYPILHYIIENELGDFIMESNESIVNLIYKKAQSLIEQQNIGFIEGKFSGIREKDYYIPQLDLFKIWHYNNKARSTSLKSLEISMNYPNVMDMPILHDKDNIKLEEIDEILEYNLNDVKATYEFFKKTVSLGKIELRKSIESKFGLKCLNWNNGKIGEELILKLYCKKTEKDYWDVKKLRTKRDIINLKDCIPDTINFTTKEFSEVKEAFENKVINFDNLNPENKKKNNKVKSIIYKDCIIDYGLGGAHGVTKSGVYESNEEFIIKTIDVASLYPNLPIVYNFYPEHLGPEFIEVYRDNIVNVRLSEKAKSKELQDKAIVDGYKEAANIPYGKSNEKFSFLYDTLFTMKTTISGQLVTSMLVERLGQIPDCKILMYNTDGAEIMISRKYEELFNIICKEWEKETNLVLEYNEYRKIWIRDINNYGCITVDGKIKNKGSFEVDKVIGNEPAYHKDNSFKVIPLAIQEYFINGVPVEKTIKNHKNIYDFCGRQKFKSTSYGETHTLVIEDGIPKDYIEQQQKNVRYYISKPGSSFIKVYSKGTNEQINKGFEVTVFNKYIEKPFEQYYINYNFYIKEAYKEINSIEQKQLELF